MNGTSNSSAKTVLPGDSVLRQALGDGRASTGPEPLESAQNVTMRVYGRGLVGFEPSIGAAGSDPRQEKNLGPVVLSAGVHGNETAPIELVDDLVGDLVSGAQPLARRLLVIIGNPFAIREQARFVEENLNRLFAGAHRGKSTLEAKRAAEIESVVGNFLSGESLGVVHYDLHTAIRASAYERFAIVPYGCELGREQYSFFASSSIEAILLANAEAPTFSYYTAHSFGAESFTVELGKVRPFGQNDRSKLAPIEGNLRLLLSGASKSDRDQEGLVDGPRTYRVIAEVFRRSESGFRLNLDDDVANFTELEPGLALTTEGGSEPGFTISEVGSRVVFPNGQVPVGQRVALIVKPEYPTESQGAEARQNRTNRE